MADFMTLVAPWTGLFGGGGGGKEARRQEDNARQAQEVADIIQSFLAQLPPGSEEYNQLLAEGQRLVQTSSSPADEQGLARELGSKLTSQLNARVAGGGAATPLEARTNKATETLRAQSQLQPFEQDVLDVLGGGSIDTPQGTFLKGLMDKASASLDPTQITSIDRFPLLMKQLEDETGKFAARRGIVGSGLELEQLGRSGIDLGLAEAQRNDDVQRLNAQLKQDAQAQKQRDVENFMNVSNVGGQLRNRQIGLEGDLVNLQLGRESNLTGLLNSNNRLATGTTNNRLQGNVDRSSELADVEADLAQSGRNNLIRGLGTAVGAAGGFALGGPAGAAMGANLGSQITGGNAPSLLAQQRSGQGTGVPQQPINSLSRTPQNNSEIEELLRQIMKQNPQSGLLF